MWFIQRTFWENFAVYRLEQSDLQNESSVTSGTNIENAARVDEMIENFAISYKTGMAVFRAIANISRTVLDVKIEKGTLQFKASSCMWRKKIKSRKPLRINPVSKIQLVAELIENGNKVLLALHWSHSPFDSLPIGRNWYCTMHIHPRSSLILYRK